MKKCKVVSNTHSPRIKEMHDMVGGEYEIGEISPEQGAVRVINERGKRFWFNFTDVEIIDEDEPSKEEQEHYEEMDRDIKRYGGREASDALVNASMEELAEAFVSPPAMHATEFLNRAIELFHERGKDYDVEEERSMGKAVRAFNAITGRELTEPEGWLLLQVLKDVRQWTSPEFHRDSAEDCISYAALKAESLAQGE